MSAIFTTVNAAKVIINYDNMGPPIQTSSLSSSGDLIKSGDCYNLVESGF